MRERHYILLLTHHLSVAQTFTCSLRPANISMENVCNDCRRRIVIYGVRNLWLRFCRIIYIINCISSFRTDYENTERANILPSEYLVTSWEIIQNKAEAFLFYSSSPVTRSFLIFWGRNLSLKQQRQTWLDIDWRKKISALEHCIILHNLLFEKTSYNNKCVHQYLNPTNGWDKENIVLKAENLDCRWHTDKRK